MKILPFVDSPQDLRKFNTTELALLAQDLREVIIATVAQNGGHLAPNLGVIELTLALHASFESPRDKIIWDVGHQSYAHKLLTGRYQQFATLRQYGGISGYPKREESPHDVFEVGHSSTSLSAALGIAQARDLNHEDFHVVAVIGDGALTGGMAFEALNHIGHLGTNLIIVLNDNEMSISANVGALSTYLGRIRTAPAYGKTKQDIEALLRKIPAIGNTMARSIEKVKDTLKYLVVPGIVFEEMGITYLGPIDGHDIDRLMQVFKQAKQHAGPILVHCITQKGRGYQPAEEHPDRFHGVSPFDVKTGEPRKPKRQTYTEVFGKTVVKLAAQDERIVAITAAMRDSVGLREFARRFPDRFFDVGIAEQHAVTLAAGLAAGGLRPVVAVYSTFLQRAFDQVLHDVCLQELPVVLCLDRAGLVGQDGPTHHGVYDLSYLRLIPNITIMAPKDEAELVDMLYTAFSLDGPVAIRYPRGEAEGVPLPQQPALLSVPKAEILDWGNGSVALVAVGNMVSTAQKAAQRLKKNGIHATVVNARFVKPLDEAVLADLSRRHSLLVTLEDNSVVAGFGSAVSELVAADETALCSVIRLGIPDQFVTHGSIHDLRRALDLTPDAICTKVSAYLKGDRVTIGCRA